MTLVKCGSCHHQVDEDGDRDHKKHSERHSVLDWHERELLSAIVRVNNTSSGIFIAERDISTLELVHKEGSIPGLIEVLGARRRELAKIQLKMARREADVELLKQEITVLKAAIKRDQRSCQCDRCQKGR